MILSMLLLSTALVAGEHFIPMAQGTNVDPAGNKIEVTSRCFRRNGEPTVGVMGEMHYARVPESEWRDYIVKMREGGLDYIATYIFWIHHEEQEGVFNFSGNRDLDKFLKICEEEKMPVVLRLGPWCHGECVNGGFPEWLVNKKIGLRKKDDAYLAYVKRFWTAVFEKAVKGHLYKDGGCVVGCQLENECRGPWPYMMALKKLAVEIGFDVPFYTRTGWPAMQGRVDYGELLPLYGDYADGFWERKPQMSPGAYKNAFKFSPTRASANIATEQIPAELLGKDDKAMAQYPYLTCELGGGMPSSYHRRLQVFPKDAFAMAVVKLGSGSNLLGYYMYAGGTNPNRPAEGVFFNERQDSGYTRYNDLPPFSYEFDAPISEFGERAPHYYSLKDLHDFCHAYGKEFALEEPVFVGANETRRGRFIFHNDYIRGANDSNEIWIGEEIAAATPESPRQIRKLVDWSAAHARAVAQTPPMAKRPVSFRQTKAVGAIREVKAGAMDVAEQPAEKDWAEAAVYELTLPKLPEGARALLSVAWTGDVIRLYADGVPVADQFFAGKPFKAALWRYPAQKYELKVLPWPDSPLVYVQSPFRPSARGACAVTEAAVTAGSFEISMEQDAFLLNGKPFEIRCGEMHYARIPREYWRDRLKSLKEMGFNAVGCYMFWNFHERAEGVFNWTGRADAAAFCRLAQEEGLWVILRPGPYSCAEWEGGGAPWWLLKHDDIAMRSSDPKWLEPAKKWIAEVGRQLAPLQITRGGPILMVQVENEYGLHGGDVNYMRALRRATREAGFEVPLYACNPPRVTQNGFIPELFQAANFGADPKQRFEIIRQFQPKGPLMCAEYYPAWFDCWGQSHHPPKRDQDFFGPIDWMLQNHASFSLYMAHGGTSFGGWTGCRNPFVPNVTSYDYEAPIKEDGSQGPFFAKLQARLGGKTVARERPATRAYGEVELTRGAGVEALITREVKLEQPIYMEKLDQGFGLVAYETTLPAGVGGALKVESIHDFGYVSVDGVRKGVLDRRHRGVKIRLDAAARPRTLRILVEAMGRINSSQGMEDRKGLDGAVSVGGVELRGWTAKMMPIDPDGQKIVAFHQGTWTIPEEKPSDTWLDLSAWGKGIAWVNGHNLGRFWNIGPQQTLFVPGCWLKKGLNEVTVLDFFEGAEKKSVHFVDRPILNEVHLEKDFNRMERETKAFAGVHEVAQGTFPCTDEAQVVRFEKPIRADRFTLQALSSHDAKRGYVSIGEFDLLDAQGNPLTALGLRVTGASSEEEITADGSADNALDGQVETAWQTSSRTLPAWIEFKATALAEIHGFRLTPKLGKTDWRIKDFKFYADSSIPSPQTVVSILAERLLGTSPDKYAPAGYLGKRYGNGGYIHYSVVSLWANALMCARQMGDTNLTTRLVAAFEPYLNEKTDRLKDWRHVDMAIVGALALEVAIQTGDARARKVGLEYADRQWEEPLAGQDFVELLYDPIPLEERRMRWKQGYSAQTRLWIDDMYMITFLQTQAYRLTKDVKYLDRAAKEMCLYLERLQRPDGLFNHSPETPFVWGRGAGWMAGAMALNLKYLPKDSPYYAPIRAGYVKMMTALLKYQRANGLWGQLVDDDESYDETSGSAMFAFAFVEGVKAGVLGAEYRAAAERAFVALTQKLDAKGDLANVCVGTGKRNDRTWYLTRPAVAGDPHGQAPLMWLCGALLSCPSESSVTPLLGGFHPDPSVCKGRDGAYYLVTSSFAWLPGLPIYRSENFREWARVGHALNDFSAVADGPLGGKSPEDDGVKVQAYLDGKPFGEAQDTSVLAAAAKVSRFNGLGIGIK